MDLRLSRSIIIVFSRSEGENMNNFEEIFIELKSVLDPYEQRLILKHNTSENYYLNTSVNPIKPKEEGFFGAVQMKKNYVSFHLFPVYVFPELLSEITGDLRKRMQGKSCFNFKKSDTALINELGDLVNMGFDKFKENKMI